MRLMRVAHWALLEFAARDDDAPRADWAADYRHHAQPALEALALLAVCLQREPVASLAIDVLKQLSRVALYADGRSYAAADAHLATLDAAGRSVVAAGLSVSRRGSLIHALPRHSAAVDAPLVEHMYSIFAGRSIELALASAKARLRGSAVMLVCHLFLNII